MKVPLDWLAEWIDLPESRDALLEKLTFAGLEIEDVIELVPEVQGVVVGFVRECAQHPNADRLSQCVVETAEGEVHDVVCGAPNVAHGQKVAFAPVGTVLPDGTKLKKAKIRGLPSLGMICSERELGLSGDHEGILVLDEDAPVGAPLAQVLSRPGAVLDLEITPNRGDWASMLGMAREVRTHFGGELKLPPTGVEEAGAAAADDIAIEIRDIGGCPGYLGRIVRGVTIGPSPDWLVAKLEAAGVRAINVVVDVTNLVLLEFGQPLHAFDLSMLHGRQVIVRGARAGEKIATLDGQIRELVEDDLVIADADRAVAIAGVMGGAETEVCDGTCDVLLECAQFAPARIRKTARRLGLHSEASYRFERGVDRDGLQRAVDRAARLLAELASGEVAPGTVDARGTALPLADPVKLDPARPNRLLGTNLEPSEVADCLRRVDIEVVEQADGSLLCTAPTYRNDIALPVDLIEEVARVYGYENIPETMPAAFLHETAQTPRQLAEWAVRDAVVAAGWVEARTPPWGPESDAEALRLAGDDPRRNRLRLRNPIAEENPLLRTQLLPSLLRAVRHNLAHQVDRVRLFEVGSVFQPGVLGELPNERLAVAGVVTRGEQSGLWEAEPPVFFEAKGAVERLALAMGQAIKIRALADLPSLHPGAAAELRLGKQPIGSLGELHPEVAAAFEIDVPCAVFELDLAPFQAQAQAQGQVRAAFQEISRHPVVRRDIAVLLDDDCAAGDVLGAIRQTAGTVLSGVELFDRYEGQGVPEGRVSLGFRLTLQRPDRTLTDAEITKLTNRVRQMLVKRFSGELR